MAYTRLLRAYYRREKPIPIDEAYRLVRATTAAQRKAVDVVLREFFEQGEGGWRNKRADEEVAAYQHQAETNRRIARKRIVHEPSHEPCIESLNESSTKRAPNHKPLAINQEPDTSNSKSTTTAPDATRRGLKVNGHRIDFDPAKGVFTGITEDMELAWQDAYPAVPVPPAIARAAAWLVANPANRKSNNHRFIVNWLGREQEKAGRVR